MNKVERYLIELRDNEYPHGEDKPLPAYAWPGGHPMLYYCADGDVLCADCAMLSLREEVDWAATDSCVFYEGPPEYCANCNKRIASAYGDPDCPVCNGRQDDDCPACGSPEDQA